MSWLVEKLGELVAGVANMGLEKAKAHYLKFNGQAAIAEEVYKGLVNQKELTKIEDLPETEKRRFWNESKGAIDPTKTDDQNLKRRKTYCRAVYLIEVVLKKES